MFFVILVMEMPPKGAKALRRPTYWHLLEIPLHHVRKIPFKKNAELPYKSIEFRE
jgi:hypothetical protein